MAVVKDRMKRLFADARSRLVIVLTAFILLFAIVAGYFIFHHRSAGPAPEVQLAGTHTNIQSIPGTQPVSEQYKKLQEEQNKQQAEQALKTGGSAYPTVTTIGTLGQGTALNQPGGLSFSTLQQQGQKPL